VSNAPPQSPAEGFATIIRWLVQSVAAMSGGDRLTYRVIGLIADRIRVINQGFKRLVARLAAGTYKPRHGFHRSRPIDPKPRRPNPLPEEFGWLLTLVPDAIGYRSQLEYLFRDPAMAALMAAAPASMARVLRPLCWMLRLPPPPILARPRPRPRREPEPEPGAGPAPEAGPAPPAAPAPPLQPGSRRSPPPGRPAPRASPVACACGPPRPA
jgi:hypothetical protein